MISANEINKLNSITTKKNRMWTPPSLDYVKYKLIIKALIHFDGDKKKVSDHLRIDVGYLERKTNEMRTMGIDVPNARKTTISTNDIIINRGLDKTNTGVVGH